MILDFYGDQNKLRQTLLQFIFSNTNGLYENVNYFWEKPIDDRTVSKQLAMIEFCKSVYEQYKTGSEIILPEGFLDGSYTYVLFDVSPFSFNGLRVWHPNKLSNFSTHIHFFNGYDYFQDLNFYISRPFLRNKNIMLTNGANESLNEEGGGTTAGLRRLDGKRFFERWRKIYKPEKVDIHDSFFKDIVFFDDKHQVVPVYRNPFYDRFTAGTVFRTDVNYQFVDENSKPIYTISGVYHIKGIDWTNEDKSVEKSLANIIFVQEYYSAIIEDFLKNIYVTVLYLAQIPGANFKGGKGTLQGLVNAVSKHIQELLNADKHVIVGMQKPVDFMEPLSSNMYFWYNLFLSH